MLSFKNELFFAYIDILPKATQYGSNDRAGRFHSFYGQGQKWTVMDEMDWIFHGQNGTS